jgi:DNA-binding NarL/FixJ family response regulator
MIVDDHTLVRAGLREILHADGGVFVVGEAGDSESAVSMAARTRPQVVLLDIEIPGGEASTTVTRIRSVSPVSQVIILSMYDGPHLLRSLLDVGIRGYLLKSVTREELMSAIRRTQIDDGEILLAVSRECLLQIQRAPSGLLSPREREVLKLVALALSNTQIASRLSLTEATVKRHLRNIFIKLGAVSRIDAVNKAVAAYLITVPRVPPAQRALPLRLPVLAAPGTEAGPGGH